MNVKMCHTYFTKMARTLQQNVMEYKFLHLWNINHQFDAWKSCDNILIPVTYYWFPHYHPHIKYSVKFTSGSHACTTVIIGICEDYKHSFYTVINRLEEIYQLGGELWSPKYTEDFIFKSTQMVQTRWPEFHTLGYVKQD